MPPIKPRYLLTVCQQIPLRKKFKHQHLVELVYVLTPLQILLRLSCVRYFHNGREQFIAVLFSRTAPKKYASSSHLILKIIN